MLLIPYRYALRMHSVCCTRRGGRPLPAILANRNINGCAVMAATSGSISNIGRTACVMRFLSFYYRTPNPVRFCGYRMTTSQRFGSGVGSARISTSSRMQSIIRVGMNKAGSTSSMDDEDNDSFGDDGVVGGGSFEECLKEMTSEKLYDLATRTCSVADMQRRLAEKQLDLFPSYQRDFVWKPDRASRLIVTLLCTRVLPVIVLHEKKKGIYDVVDGKQRLTSILCWYNGGKWPDSVQAQNLPSPIPCLAGLKDEYEKLNGLSFADLSDERRFGFMEYNISYQVIPFKTPSEDVFQVYSDINCGGMDLSAQQLRKAAFDGRYTRLLEELATKSTDFQNILSPCGEYALDPKEADRELILRGFAFEQSWKLYKTPTKSFLNDELKRVNNMSDTEQVAEIQRLRHQFLRVMRVARELFGSDGAFRRWNAASGSWEARSPEKSTVVWDPLYGILAELLLDRSETDFVRNKSAILQAVKQAVEITSDDFCSGRLSGKALRVRREVLGTAICEHLPKVSASDPSDRRSFGRCEELIREMFEEQNGMCGICQQPLNEDQIMDGSYSNIDHIQPVARGGKTDRSNGQLTHRGCNLCKGASWDDSEAELVVLAQEEDTSTTVDRAT